MFTKIVAIVFSLLNVTLFVQIGLEVAAVTPEQAILEGMTQRIYASTSHIDYIMAALWVAILWNILVANKEWFLRAVWLYLGLYLWSVHSGYYMAIEMNDFTWTIIALLLVTVQCGFLFWAEMQINTVILTR